MRQAVVCEGTTASYRLEVRYHGEVIAQQVVRGGGLRHDRPLYVSRDIQLPPGDADLSVKFVRVDAQASPAASDRSHSERSAGSPPGSGAPPDVMDPDRRRREGEERRHSREETIPPRLSLERRLHFASRRVILVTYDSERREFVIVEERTR